MNRENLSEPSLAASTAGQSPTLTERTQDELTDSPKNNTNPNGFKRFSLGNLVLTVLSDGYSRHPAHPVVAPLAQPDEVKAVLEAAFRPTDSIDSALNILVVESKDRLILLDTGMGVFADPMQGHLFKSLADAGFKATDFTDVILSHAHTDHIGGLVNKQNEFVFSNADIYIAKAEYDFWQRATLDDFQRSPAYQMEDFVRQTITDIQTVLNLLAPKLKFIDFDRELHGIFSFELAPGHTPGHTLITIRSNGETLIDIVDLVHSDAVLFAHPEWGFFGDTDLQQAVLSRIKILQQLSTSKIKAFTYHLPWPGLGHVRQKETAFEWVPDVYATP